MDKEKAKRIQNIIDWIRIILLLVFVALMVGGLLSLAE